MQGSVLLYLCLKTLQTPTVQCGVVLVSTGPQQLSQARHYDIYNIYNIETNNQQMWHTSTFRPAEGQQKDRHRFTFSLLANKLETSQISLFKVSIISNEWNRNGESLWVWLDTGHRPHTLELCLICIKFRNFPIYISIYLSFCQSSLYLLLITDLQYWNVEIFPGNRNLNKVFVQQQTFVEFLLLFSSTVRTFEMISSNSTAHWRLFIIIKMIYSVEKVEVTISKYYKIK